MVAGAAPANAGAAPAVRLIVTVNGAPRPAVPLDCADPTCDVPNNPNYPNQVTTPSGTVAVPAGVSEDSGTGAAPCRLAVWLREWAEGAGQLRV